MAEAVLLVLTQLSSLCGMAWLALAMEVHWRQARAVRHFPPGTARRLRVLGVAALLASLAFCLTAEHLSIAALVWIMTLTASALIVTFTLAWRPRWLAPLAR